MTEVERSKSVNELAEPIAETCLGKLPSAVVFYLDVKQRRDLLSALKRYSGDRSRAILLAMELVEAE